MFNIAIADLLIGLAVTFAWIATLWCIHKDIQKLSKNDNDGSDN